MKVEVDGGSHKVRVARLPKALKGMLSKTTMETKGPAVHQGRFNRSAGDVKE